MTVPRAARVPNLRLKQLRAERGLTQEDLVKELRRAGWSTCGLRTIQGYESGEFTAPSWGARRALETVFGMSVDQLGFTELAGVPSMAVGVTRVPARFYVFDHFRGDEAAMNRRTHACWDWCDRTAGTECLDEFVAWENDAQASFRQKLREALDACESSRASLLVYNLEVLDEADVREVINELRSQELWKLSPAPGAVSAP